MSRATTNKLYRNFSKGLITEASPLTYPENSCSDLDNCILLRKGNIRRRYGIDFEDNWGWSNHAIYQSTYKDYAISEFSWTAAANDITKNFLVIQTGLDIRFYDLNSSDLSHNQKSFMVDMTPYLAANATAADGQKCELQFDSGKGFLFVVGKKFEPISIEYLVDADAIKISRVYIQVRDFHGVNDGLGNDEEPATLSTSHNYNLLNQGWYDSRNDGTGSTIQRFDGNGTITSYASPPQTPITAFFTANSKYPGNNKQWWVAKDATTLAFDPALLNKFAFGTSRSPRGHFILNAFYKDRSAASGLAGIPVESTDRRPSSVAFFSGRVWYLSGSSLYFSQILDDVGKAGMCYQSADPTSEDISDLIASDGGIIEIPEMADGIRLLPAAGGILAFASNGVWHISGTAGGFAANDISQTRVTPIGIESPKSIVEGKEGIFYFDKVGIRTMVVATGAGGTSFDVQTISEATVQSLWLDIPEANRKYIKGVYDSSNNVIQWLYRSVDDGETYQYNKILNLDLTLKSFYPWTTTVIGPRIAGVFLTPTVNKINSPYDASVRDSPIKYYVAVPQDISFFFTFAFHKNYRFIDWEEYNGVGFDPVAYLESGYELLEDAMRKKELNYVFCYFKKTETNWVADGDSYVPDNRSSCYFQTKWDWADSQISNKFSNKIQAYRFTRFAGVDTDTLKHDTGFPIVVTKNKIRGTGRAIQFRFESEPGYDFDLLGWAVPYSGNTLP